MATACFVTMARDRQVVENYLYSYAEVAEALPPGREGVGTFLVQVSGRTEAEAMLQASNQAARLNTGIYPTTEVFLGRESAIKSAAEKGWT